MSNDKSFIYDEFVQELMKLAQQAAPAAPPPGAVNEYARQLVTNLEGQVSEFTADKENAELSTTHLTSLDNLFQFLASNGMKRMGFPIVVRTKIDSSPELVDFKTYNEAEKARYAPYPESNPDYYVNKPLLIAYLQDLLKQRNPLLNALLKQRIQDANTGLKLGVNPDAAVPNAVGPDGKPVSLTSDQSNDKASSSFTDNTGKPGAASSQDAKALANKRRELLLELNERLPFSLNDIDFDRIKLFLGKYRELINSDSNAKGRAGNISQNINLAMSVMDQEIGQHLLVAMESFSMDKGPDYYSNIVKSPRANHYVALFDRLKRVIQSTAYVVEDLYKNYDELPDREKVAEQVIGSASYFKRNWDQLREMESRVGEVK